MNDIASRIRKNYTRVFCRWFGLWKIFSPSNFINKKFPFVVTKSEFLYAEDSICICAKVIVVFVLLYRSWQSIEGRVSFNLKEL